MEDRHVVALAVASAMGAWVAASAPAWVGHDAVALATGVTALVALRLRWRVMAIAAGCALALVLGARSWAGLDPPPPGTPWAGPATLATDPVRIGAGWKVELRLADGTRAEAFAYGRSGAALSSLLAGERVVGAGTMGPPPRPAQARLAVRHVATRLSLSECRRVDGGRLGFRAANGLRRLLMRGTASFDPDTRALWAGLVIGDDREEDPGIADDFSAAGLTHLLAVSGQNVAFALAAAGPVLRRLGLRGRVAAGLGVLGLFGVVVRFEPSVMRASAMAALALLAAGKGVEASAVRVVGLAVTGLILIDPFLVHRLGFQLSVAATVGIAVVSRPLAAWLPGPSVLREPLATTLAAQAAVAPLLVGLGGTSPVSIPANVLALPAAGPVMVWGLTGGVVAGVAGGPVATIVHLPSQVLLGWLTLVARVAARVPLPPLGLGLVMATLACAVAAALWPRRRRVLAAAATVLFVVPSAVAGVVPPATPAVRAAGTGAAIWRHGDVTVVVVGAADPARVLGGLRRASAGKIDLLVVDGTGRGVLAVVSAVTDRHDVRGIAGSPKLDIDGLVPLGRGPVGVGRFSVTLDATGHPVVTVTGGR